MTAQFSSFAQLTAYMSRRAPLLIARKGIEIVFSLIVVAVLARTLTKQEFAIYSLIFSFISIARLAAFPGIGLAVSQSFARGARGGYRAGFWLSLAGSLLGGAAIVGIGFWNLGTDNAVMGQMLIVTGLAFPMVGGMMLWRDAAMGAEAYQWFLYFESAIAIGRCLAIVACAWLYPGALFPVVVAALAVPALVNLVASLAQLRNVSASSAREPGMLRYGIEVSLYQLPSVLSQHLDRFILFYLVAPETLAVYAIALRIPELARALVGDTNATLGPVFAREKHYSPQLHRFSLNLWAIYVAVSLFGALVVVPIALPILVGEAYSDAILPAQIMTAGVALEYLGNIQFRYIKSHRHGRGFFDVTLMSSVIRVAVTVPLALLFGLAGVTAAYVVKSASYTLITNFVVHRLKPEAQQ